MPVFPAAAPIGAAIAGAMPRDGVPLSLIGPPLALIGPDHLGELAAARTTRAQGGFAAAAAKANADALRSRAKLFEQEGPIALIPITGMLVNNLGCIDPLWGMTGYDGIRTKVEAAAADPDVSAIALLVDSGGGEVAGCADCARTIARAAAVKPVAAILAEVAYSAAYWLASQAQTIAVPVTGGVGSVGVVSLHIGLTRLLEKEGVEVTVMRAGGRKAEANPFEPLSDQARADWQREIDAIRTLFVGAVARGRKLDPKVVLATEAACIPQVTGDALRLGFADAELSPFEAWAQLAAHSATTSTRNTSTRNTTSRRPKP